MTPSYPIKLIPLGGLGEIGQNMLVVEYQEEIIIIDAGLIFPHSKLTNVDFGIPDTTYLENKKDNIKAILVTHGHEDHIGAIPHLLEKIQVPVYSSPLTTHLIKSKLRRTKTHNSSVVVFKEIEANTQIQIGPFEITFFRVTHSIPDSMGIAINTPCGMIIHTGDFKIDQTPNDGIRSDLSHIASIAKDGVLMLCSDSTYAELPGYSESESLVRNSFSRIMTNSQDRLIIATFASLITRIQAIIDLAPQYDRNVSVMGRSMVRNLKIAQITGHIKDPYSVLKPISEVNKLPPHKAIIVGTGGQGESNSFITKLSKQAHSEVNISSKDTIIISSSPIPGNEPNMGIVIDNLLRCGAKVIYNKIDTVHVHGHAKQEELKLMLSITNPKFFVPIHGELRHLVAHSHLAASMGLSRDNIFVLEKGDVLEINPNKAKVTGTVPAGTIYIKNETSS